MWPEDTLATATIDPADRVRASRTSLARSPRASSPSPRSSMAIRQRHRRSSPGRTHDARRQNDGRAALRRRWEYRDRRGNDLPGCWCRLGDSNTRPPHYECGALPAELRRLRRGRSGTGNRGRRKGAGPHGAKLVTPRHGGRPGPQLRGYRRCLRQGLAQAPGEGCEADFGFRQRSADIARRRHAGLNTSNERGILRIDLPVDPPVEMAGKPDLAARVGAHIADLADQRFRRRTGTNCMKSTWSG